MPWIAKLNPTSATRTSVPKLRTTTYQAPGRRLWLRVRRRLRALGILRLYATSRLSPEKDGPYLLLYHKAVCRRSMLSGCYVVRKSATGTALRCIVWPIFWTIHPG